VARSDVLFAEIDIRLPAIECRGLSVGGQAGVYT
jgi:hypothetical protein